MIRFPFPVPGFPLVLGAMLAAFPCRAQQTYVGGRWFDGTDFVARVVHSVDGVLRFGADYATSDTVELKNGFVVPPFAEAHNHNLGGCRQFDPETVLRNYARDGVLYVKI